ncbi:MFS transporter [Streptomyces yaizuensis]|uniref:MFS transporter n=1 Tax=Streptomyces yaizuensis TaxID=2989713 RepID=A0ABQ5P368_9ACTN|nr:MFS transporter [Streptomyces sp. YSPA8]GLF97048.1 MFS transporter [Streptomyces sp. YSPA8]
MPQRTAEHRTGEAGGRGVVAVLAGAAISVAVMQTLVVPVIADLPVLLDTSAATAGWVVTSTLLAAAVATPVMGRLGDLHGKRRMLVVSLAVMVTGSLISAGTDDPVVMIVGRTLQGFGMGVIPLGIGIMRDVLPGRRLASGLAVMSSSIGVGGGLALPAAALVAQHTDWHALFLGSALLGTVSAAAVLAVVPGGPGLARGGFDLPGAVGLTAGMVALLLPVTKGDAWGWTAPVTLALFGAAALLLTVWGWWELRCPSPLVDLRTSARREVLLTNLASLLLGMAFYTISLVLPALLQLPTGTGYGLGQSMVTAGLALAPLGLTMLLVSPLYARLSERYGPRAALLTGMAVLVAGHGAGIVMMAAVWQTVVIAVVLGVGIGLAYSALPALINAAVDPSRTGAANGLNALMRSVGTAVSSAVVGMVLARTARTWDGVAVPGPEGFRISFALATGAVAVGMVLAFLLPARRGARAVTAPGTGPEPGGPAAGSARGAAPAPHSG